MVGIEGRRGTAVWATRLVAGPDDDERFAMTEVAGALPRG
ncbi:hypothetical protein ABIA38_006569 [Embleya sp. AB8]